MRFMNDYDIDLAQRHATHPVLGPAVRQLKILRDYADENSDGWAYWPKPARSAARLMALVEGDREVSDPRCQDCGVMGNQRHYRHCKRLDATEAELRKALVPVKALRTRLTREGMPGFEVVQV